MRIGKLSETVLKRSVIRQIRSKRIEVMDGAGVGRDCAILAFGEGARTAVCVQEAVIHRMDDMGLLINHGMNSLAAAGASPAAVTLALLLPEVMEESELRELMAEAEGVCKGLNLQIAGGHTAVSGAVSQPVASITAYGALEKKLKGAVPGQDIVLSKWIGLEGTSLLAEESRAGLLTRYPEYLVEEARRFREYISVIPEAELARQAGVSDMHDASEGGVFAALWELAERAGVGLTIDLKKLPIRQETVEVCEYLELNPYELLSGGCLVMVSEDGPGLVHVLAEAGIPARVVGSITEGNDRLILNDGEARYMDRPKTDEIYKGMERRFK